MAGPFVILLALVAVGFAQGPADRALTNADVVRMLNAGIPESVVVRKIRVSETNFLTTPDALIELKHQSVPNGVLEAIVDSQVTTRTLAVEPPVVNFAGGSAVPPHPHNLPNIDASFRLDSKTTGKVQVRKNEIKVEKAGVPLFSLKWKENPSK
jgi:hypothetical protein